VSELNDQKQNLRVSLCLLTWNELEGCKRDLPKIPPVFDRIYAIDNSSVDGTVEFLIENGIEVIKQDTKTYNGAYVDAINELQESSVVFFHPKGTINVDSLLDADIAMRSGIDFLLASRIMNGGQNEEDSKLFKPRKWFVLLVSYACKVRWGIGKRFYLDDPLHGYRGLSMSFIQSLELKPSGVTADVEMIKHAYRGGFRLKKFPVVEFPRTIGSTHFPAFSTGKKILRYVFTY
jgi:glycosyltransferase involved in cell wall biosynthesis